MKQHLKDFYEENKGLFEITAVILVFTGLILNLPQEAGFLGECLRQLKFFLLFGSCVALLFLMFPLIKVVLKPFASQMDARSQKSQEIIKESIKFVIVAFFALLLYVLFFANFVLFIILSYPLEFSIMDFIFLLYFIAYISARDFTRMKNGTQLIFIGGLISLLFVLPIVAYISIYLPGDLNLIVQLKDLLRL